MDVREHSKGLCSLFLVCVNLTMKEKKDKRVLYILGGLLLVVLGVWVVLTPRTRQKPPPSAPGYYTGPFRKKIGVGFVTESGKEVSLPNEPGASASADSQKLGTYKDE